MTITASAFKGTGAGLTPSLVQPPQPQQGLWHLIQLPLFLPPPLSLSQRVNRLFGKRKAAGTDHVSPAKLKHCTDQLSPVCTDSFQHLTGDMQCDILLQNPPPSFLSPKKTTVLQTKWQQTCCHLVQSPPGCGPFKFLIHSFFQPTRSLHSSGQGEWPDSPSKLYLPIVQWSRGYHSSS